MKKWLIVVVSLLVLLALVAVGLVMTYRTALSKNFLVSQIEASIDSRVQVGDLGISLFTVPATVVISDVIIARRDDAAREGVPHDERPMLESGEIQVGEIRFDLSLRELLAKEIKVSQLKVTGARAKLVMNEAGELNIESLFAVPAETQKDKKDKKDDGLNAKDSRGVVTELDRLIIEDASFDLLIEKTGLEIVGRGVNLDLSDIRVDPDALEKVNEAQLEFAAQFEAFSNKGGRLKYGQIGLDGPARVRLFDPATGSLAPDATIDFAIDPSSYVSAKAPYIVKLWDLTDKLAKLGLKTGALPEQLGFGRKRMLSARYANDRIDLRESVSLVMDDWEMALDGGSWAELATEQHASGARLIASAKLSEWVRANLHKLSSLAPESTREQLHQEFLNELFADERLTLRAATRGPLSDPKVKMETRLPEAKKVVKDAAKAKALDFLFDKLQK